MDRLKLRPEDCGVEARRLSGRLHDLPSHWKELPDTFRENYLSEVRVAFE